MAFGIESGNQEMLNRMGKKTKLAQAEKSLAMTRQAGILSSIYFLVGLPWETHETLADNDRFARKLDPDVLEIFYVYPFPGTPLYAECVRLELLKPGEIPRNAYDGPAMASLHFTRGELSAARTRSLRKYYMRPRVILRTLAKARSLKELANYLGYGFQMLKELLISREAR
jgi:anaerobic magnesium-protoporphyrin IX monomethyl ester cyclase